MELHDTGLSGSARSGLPGIDMRCCIALHEPAALRPKAAVQRRGSAMSRQPALWRPAGALRQFGVIPPHDSASACCSSRHGAMKTKQHLLDGL